MCVLCVGTQGDGARGLRETVWEFTSGTSVRREELAGAFRSFFVLANDVVNNQLLNCRAIFGESSEGGSDYVHAIFAELNQQVDGFVDRLVDQVFRAAGGGGGDTLSWADFSQWTGSGARSDLSEWMGRLADLWCEAVADDDSLFTTLYGEEDPELDHGGIDRHAPGYEDYYKAYELGGPHKKKPNKYKPPYFLSGPVAPVPGGLGAMGYPYQVSTTLPSSLALPLLHSGLSSTYIDLRRCLPLQSYLKKIFSMTLISHRTNHKKFTYRNPYAKRTCFSFHSSNPNILEIKQPQLVVPPNQQRFARLTFHPASPGNAECLLYIHNDDADRNEECIRFDVSFMKDATNPFDKFAGLYGSKTYWGYDGADTGSDPWVDRLWDPSQGGGGGGGGRHRHRPRDRDGWESDSDDEYYPSRRGGGGGRRGGGRGDPRYDEPDYGGARDQQWYPDDRRPGSPKDFLERGQAKSRMNDFIEEGKRRSQEWSRSSWDAATAGGGGGFLDRAGGSGQDGPRSPEQFFNTGREKGELLDTVYGGGSKQPGGGGGGGETRDSVEGFLDKGRRRSQIQSRGGQAF
eukprot:SAG22_NODE_948_length_6363_cov_1.935664_4_plen_572_part_00